MSNSSDMDVAAEFLLEEAKVKDSRASIEEMRYSISYLTVFGYLAEKAWSHRDAIVDALVGFQKWFGESEDGIVGAKTLKAMQTPRCGCPDIVQKDNPAHIPYVKMLEHSEHSLRRWNRTGLAYHIEAYVNGISEHDQQAIIAGAWKAWSDVCGINIRHTPYPDEANFIIGTGEGNRSHFDGPGGTLAWATMPKENDEQLVMKFDLTEKWIVDPTQRGTLMFNVACHEFGHLLGLSHSKEMSSLMSPYYNPVVSVPQWNDDIIHAQARYGQTPARPLDPSKKVYTMKCRDLEIQEEMAPHCN